MKRLINGVLTTILIFMILLILSVAENLIDIICSKINGDIVMTILIVIICGIVIGSIIKPDKF